MYGGGEGGAQRAYQTWINRGRAGLVELLANVPDILYFIK